MPQVLLMKRKKKLNFGLENKILGSAIAKSEIRCRISPDIGRSHCLVNDGNIHKCFR